jgi:hypothetical protein
MMRVTPDSLTDEEWISDARDPEAPHRFNMRMPNGRVYCATCGVYRFIAELKDVGCYSVAHLRFIRRIKVAVALVAMALLGLLIWATQR